MCSKGLVAPQAYYLDIMQIKKGKYGNDFEHDAKNHSRVGLDKRGGDIANDSIVATRCGHFFMPH